MVVEFKSRLASGQNVFVMAEVDEDVELLHVMTGDTSDAGDIPLGILSREDRLALEIEAGVAFTEYLHSLDGADGRSA